MKATASVDDYLKALPPTTRKVLQKVRAIVAAAAPDLDEVIAYQMPGWRYDGRPVLYAAGWQQHWSLYPAGRNVAARFGKELSRYEVSRGTIRFKLDELPEDLLTRIVKHRAEEARAEAALRRANKPAKKATMMKTAAKKTVAKKAPAKKATTKKTSMTQTIAKPAKKAPAKKATAKTSKKATAKKATAKKAPAKKAPAKKTTAKKSR